jgi:hypothetical protein
MSGVTQLDDVVSQAVAESVRDMERIEQPPVQALIQGNSAAEQLGALNVVMETYSLSQPKASR